MSRIGVHFTCPHCSGMFLIDGSAAGQQVACPHCRGVVMIAAAAPKTPARPLPARPVPARPLPLRAAAASSPQTELAGPISLRGPVETVSQGTDEVELRKLSPEEKARRRLRKNLVLWVFGLLLMSITLALLLLAGPL